MSIPHFHLDIETLGLLPTSVVLSVGVVEIDFNAGKIVREMHVNIDPEDCEFYGLTTDQSTVDWWEKQSDGAKARTFNKKTAQNLKAALLEVSEFINRSPSETIEVSAFGLLDIPVLENAYRAVGLTPPWAYWQVQDMRTLTQWFSEVLTREKPKDAHDALVDATYQAEHLIRIRQHIDSLRTPASLIDADGSSPAARAIAELHNFVQLTPRDKRPVVIAALMDEWAVLQGREPRQQVRLCDIVKPSVATVDDDEL